MRRPHGVRGHRWRSPKPPGGNTPRALLGTSARTWSQQDRVPPSPKNHSSSAPSPPGLGGPVGFQRVSRTVPPSPSVGLGPTRWHRRAVAPQREEGTEAETRGNDEFLLLRSSQSPHGRRWTPLTHDGDFTARQNNTTPRGGRWRGAGPARHPRCPFPSPARGRGHAVPPCVPAAPRPPHDNPGESGTSGGAIQTKLVQSPG